MTHIILSHPRPHRAIGSIPQFLWTEDDEIREWQNALAQMDKLLPPANPQTPPPTPHTRLLQQLIAEIPSPSPVDDSDKENLTPPILEHPCDRQLAWPPPSHVMSNSHILDTEHTILSPDSYSEVSSAHSRSYESYRVPLETTPAYETLPKVHATYHKAHECHATVSRISKTVISAGRPQGPRLLWPRSGYLSNRPSTFKFDPFAEEEAEEEIRKERKASAFRRVLQAIGLWQVT